MLPQVGAAVVSVSSAVLLEPLALQKYRVQDHFQEHALGVSISRPGDPLTVGLAILLGAEMEDNAFIILTVL